MDLNLISHLRQFHLALLLAPALLLVACGGAQSKERERTGTGQVGEGNVRIGAFNLQNFGPTKSSQPATVNSMARIAIEYDALVLQEIEDVGGDLPADSRTI